MRAFAAVTVLAALTSGTAIAAAPAAPAASRSTEITNEAKLRAARLIGYPEDKLELLLQHTHRNLVFYLWDHVKDNPKAANVYQAGLAALRAETEEAYAHFVNTEIHAAHQRDLAAEAERLAENERRRKAAELVGVTVTDAMLIISRKNFVFELWDRTPKQFEQVRKAALVAYDGDEAARLEFLTTGVFAAKKLDDEEIKRREEAEKERLKHLEAKKKAWAVLGLPYEGWIEHSTDRHFVFEIWKRTDSGPLVEVHLAALRALESEDPAKEREFIHTGIHQAHAKDLAEAEKKKDQENQRQITIIMARGDNSGLNPIEADAARRALAGTPEDRAKFLAQDRSALRRQSLRATTPGLPENLFLRHANGFGGISPVEQGSGELAKQDATWKIVPALSTTTELCYSFESVNFPGYFLRHSDYRISLQENDRSELFGKDASFCAHKNKFGQGVALESMNIPGRYLRHTGGGIYLANDSGQFAFDNPHLFREDATWRTTDPWVS